jgi:phage tail-like protein
MTAVRHLIGQYRILAVLVAVIAVAAGGQLSGRSTQNDLPRYSFTVTIEGRTLGTFREVSGLDVEFEVVEYRDRSGGPVQYFPGVTKYSSIKLSRAFTGDTALSDWFTAFSQAPTERVAGSIVLFDQTGQEISRYHFEHAWPKKISGPTLSAGGTDVPIESIELVHEGLTRVAPTR